MTTKSLGNPFDGDKSLIHAKSCGCPECKPGDSAPSISLDLKPSAGQQAVADEPLDSEAMMDRAIELKAPSCARCLVTTNTAAAAS